MRNRGVVVAMWPFKSAKSRQSSAVATAQARLPTGQFAPPGGVNPVRELRQDAEKLDAMGDWTDKVVKLVGAVDKMRGHTGVGEAAEGVIDDGMAGSIADILNSDTAAIIAPFIGPYIPALLEKYAGVRPVSLPSNSPPDGPHPPDNAPASSTSTITPPTTPAGIPGDIVTYIQGAAKVGAKGVKAALKLPGARDALEKGVRDSLGMELTDLKKATHNISEAL